MKDFYKNTRITIDEYNAILDKVNNEQMELTDTEDEFIANFCIHLAHALIKDTGEGQLARQELGKVADLINIVIFN